MPVDPTPVQRTGERQAQRRSRSKGQQIIEVMELVGAASRQFHNHLRDKAATEGVDVASAYEIIRLSDKLRELIRIPR
jgi:hypothetical protein